MLTDNELYTLECDLRGLAEKCYTAQKYEDGWDGTCCVIHEAIRKGVISALQLVGQEDVAKRVREIGDE